MAGMRGVAPEEAGKKNEWVLESNATSDPALARLIEVVDDQSDTARLLRAHMGTFESGDVLHLREASERERTAEAELKGAERSAFEALRAQEAEREHVERERERARARAANTAAAAAAAAAKKRPSPVVAVKRAAPAAPAPGGAPAAEAAKRARAAEVAAPSPSQQPPNEAGALAGLAAYSDSDS